MVAISVRRGIELYSSKRFRNTPLYVIVGAVQAPTHLGVLVQDVKGRVETTTAFPRPSNERSVSRLTDREAGAFAAPLSGASFPLGCLRGTVKLTLDGWRRRNTTDGVSSWR